MQRLLLLVASMVVLGSAQASDVFVTKDAQGRPIYTDRPDSLPAQKIHVATANPDAPVTPDTADGSPQSPAAAGQAQADAAQKRADSRKVKELTAEDQAKRCQESRARYQNLMNARRLYEPGSSPEERRYLDSSEIDAARADAKKVMDEFCAGQ